MKAFVKKWKGRIKRRLPALGVLFLTVLLIWLAFGKSFRSLLPLIREGNRDAIVTYLSGEDAVMGMVSVVLLSAIQVVSIIMPCMAIHIAAGVLYNWYKARGFPRSSVGVVHPLCDAGRAIGAHGELCRASCPYRSLRRSGAPFGQGVWGGVGRFSRVVCPSGGAKACSARILGMGRNPSHARRASPHGAPLAEKGDVGNPLSDRLNPKIGGWCEGRIVEPRDQMEHLPIG